MSATSSDDCRKIAEEFHDKEREHNIERNRKVLEDLGILPLAHTFALELPATTTTSANSGSIYLPGHTSEQTSADDSIASDSITTGQYNKHLTRRTMSTERSSNTEGEQVKARNNPGNNINCNQYGSHVGTDHVPATEWKTICERTIQPFETDIQQCQDIVAGIMRQMPTLDLLKESLFWDDSIASMDTKEFREQKLQGITIDLIRQVRHNDLTEAMARALVIRAYNVLFRPEPANNTSNSKRRRVRPYTSSHATTTLCHV